MDDRMLTMRFAPTPRGSCWAVESVYFDGSVGDLHIVALHAIVTHYGRLLVGDIDYQYLPEAYRPYCVRYSETEYRWNLPPLPDVNPCAVYCSEIRDWWHSRTLLLISGSAKVLISCGEPLRRAILDAVAEHLDPSIASVVEKTCL